MKFRLSQNLLCYGSWFNARISAVARNPVMNSLLLTHPSPVAARRRYGRTGRAVAIQVRVRSFSVIVLAQCGQRDAGIVQRREQCFIQQLVAQPAVEAVDERVLGRLARRDVVPVDLAVIGEGQDRVRSELSPVIADHRLGLAAGVKQGRRFSRHSGTRQ